MAEYIEREKAIELIERYGGDIAVREIKRLQAADVRSERHGRWIEEGDIQICSECGEEHSWQDYRASYCDVCGAKMDGKDSDTNGTR